MRKVEVWLKGTGNPITYDAVSLYEKGSFYCILTDDGLVRKYPIVDIFCTVEEYGAHSGDSIRKKK